MDWRSALSFGLYLLVLTVWVYGHPVRNHGKKSQHVLSKKKSQQTATQNKSKKSSFLNRQQLTARESSTEDAKKKGTIRISGPWHTDSGLDRNVDPMEDSYVKKIISSNEGLNFNKDMAEAGEVFDVNGIEDFYDRNALITYEVNGHEIPVHLKQKLTPQSQTMFPEYGHDSPPSVDTSSRTGHAYPQHSLMGHKATTFYGMSLKDMPEYKVQDTPSVGEKPRGSQPFSERTKMDEPSFDQEGASSRQSLTSRNRPALFDSSVVMPFHRQAAHREAQTQAEKFASEYEQANEFTQEDSNFGNRFHDSKRPHIESAFQRPRLPLDANEANHHLGPNLEGFTGRMNPDMEPPHSNSNERLNEFNKLKDFAAHAGFADQEELLEKLARLKAHANHPMFSNPTHPDHIYQKRPSDSVEFSDRPKLSASDKHFDDVFKAQEGLKTFFNKPESEVDDHSLQGDSRGVGRDYDGGKLAPAVANEIEEKKVSKSDDSTKFFEQLEKIDEEKQKSEREKQEMLPGKSLELNSSLADLSDKTQRFTDDGERTKAKDKLLKILGDLTSKLKGMEAAVKDTHTDERRESPSVSDLQVAKQQVFEQKAAEEAHEERAEQPPPQTEEALNQNEKSGMQRIRNYPWEATQSEAHDEKSAHLVEPSEAYAAGDNAGPNEPEGREASQEHVSYLISHLKQHNKPFIFNTEEIDYKGPSDGEKSSAVGDADIQNKNVRHQAYENEGNMLGRPIMSSFYHDSSHNSELDGHPFHSENSPSSDSSVLPTQRDGGTKDQREQEQERPLKTKGEGLGSAKDTSPRNSEEKHFKEKEVKSDPDDDLPDYNEVKDAAIFEENLIRKKYHSPSLHWSDDLSDEAQKAADDLAEDKFLDLSKKNIAKGMNAALVPLNSLNVGKDSADLWQKEAAKFDFVSPLISKKNNDFAQMVWKTAKEFGLGVAKTRDRENWLVVAKYDTPAVSEYEKLKANIESDIPVADPYSDIARSKIDEVRI